LLLKSNNFFQFSQFFSQTHPTYKKFFGELANLSQLIKRQFASKNLYSRIFSPISIKDIILSFLRTKIGEGEKDKADVFQKLIEKDKQACQ
jgi:hypothetical protein